MAEYQRAREKSAELYRELSNVTETVTAPRQVVKVTVGQTGGVIDLSFPTQAFKNMPGTDLATVILKTIGQAQAQMQARTAALLAPNLPAGVSAEDLISGKADLDALLPSRPRRSEFGGLTASDDGGRR
jgi:DNA-binding protein YbaB